jgi:large subunit ribosomal protein L15
MQLHDIKRKTANKKKFKVGRGGKHAKTAGRGTKGQSARAGNKKRPELRDMIKKLPKLRGRGKNIFQSHAVKAQVVSLDTLSKIVSAGAIVNPLFLIDKKVVRRISGKVPPVKILSDGEISVKIIVRNCKVSALAKTKIENAGGKIEA